MIVFFFVLRGFLCGGVSKPTPVMMAVSIDLIDFNVIVGREKSIFNLPSDSLEFNDAA